MEHNRRVVAVVLAAGESRRFRGLKQLVEIDGMPALWHVLDAVVAAVVDSIVVVVGHRRDEVVASVEQWHEPVNSTGSAAARPVITIVDNPAFREGQATSLQVGLQHAAELVNQSDELDVVAVVLLADQPGVSPDVIVEVVNSIGSHEVARAQHLDGPSHPVALAGKVWSRLIDEVSGDAGARTLFGELDVIDTMFDTHTPGDIDTPDDLDRAAADVRRWRARH